MKIALIQQAYKASKKDTINNTLKLIKKASKKGVDLVCLNELHQNEYFCQKEDINNFDLAKDYEKDIDFWSKVAKENNIVLISSLFEKRSIGIYHNSAIVFDKDGSIAGKYRKMHIPDDPNFYEKFYFMPGDLGFEPINTSIGRLGVLICWDQWFPEAARIMALKGADILIYPTAIGWFDSDSDEEKAKQLEAWVAIQRGHAIANGLSVLAINRVGLEKGENNTSIRFWGNSFAFGPQGEEIFRANSIDEDTFIIDIDLNRNEYVRRWWQFFRDRRVEFYQPLLKKFDDN